MDNNEGKELLKYIRIRGHYIRNKGLSFCRVDSILEGASTFDMDVFLPSIDRNLQRPLVWTQLQKEQFIISFYKGIYLPPYAVIDFRIFGINDYRQHFQVIDGKQRLSTLISFAKGEFPVTFPNNKSYFFSYLPEDLQLELLYNYLVGNVAYDYENSHISDEQKIEWFKHINFAGTPVELEHLESLTKE